MLLYHIIIQVTSSTYGTDSKFDDQKKAISKDSQVIHRGSGRFRGGQSRGLVSRLLNIVAFGNGLLYNCSANYNFIGFIYGSVFLFIVYELKLLYYCFVSSTCTIALFVMFVVPII